MRKINNIFCIFIIGLLLTSAFVLANGDPSHESQIEEARALIESEVSCDELNDQQLEAIGEYYMEQMHPGEAHEIMDKMMGGEGSESLNQMHINMAKRLYCNENTNEMMSYGMMSGCMMGQMMGLGNMMSSGIKKGGMMNMMGNNMMNYGMMGNYGYGSGYWGLINLLYLILLIGLIILVYLWIIKLWKNNKKGGRK